MDHFFAAFLLLMTGGKQILAKRQVTFALLVLSVLSQLCKLVQAKQMFIVGLLMLDNTVLVHGEAVRTSEI